MNVSIFNVAFYTVVMLAIFNPVLSGFFVDGLGIVYKSYTLILLVLAFLVVKKYRGNNPYKLLLNPATCFLFYLFFQSGITTVTAGNKLQIIRYEYFAYLLPCLGILFVSIFHSKYCDGRVYIFLSFVIYIAIASLVLDALGYADIFTGRYKNILTERYGLRQLHGFMPWQNPMANLLLLFGVLQQILNPKTVAYKIGYLATLTTLVRAHIFASFILFVTTLRGRGQIFCVGILLVIFAYLSFNKVMEDTAEFINPDTVYRLQYVLASTYVLRDYPVFGIGLGRLSDAAIWKPDKYYFHDKYGMPKELFSYTSTDAKEFVEMATSDTGLTLFAEIGIVGILLLVFQFYWFVHIAFKTNCRKFILILIPMASLFYSTPGILFSCTSGIFYWFLYGILISRYYEGVDIIAARGFDE